MNSRMHLHLLKEDLSELSRTLDVEHNEVEALKRAIARLAHLSHDWTLLLDSQVPNTEGEMNWAKFDAFLHQQLSDLHAA